jgi:exodeoxyribonuclease-3
MKIISWNVNGLRANVKKGGFDWLLNEKPDIFCLQETKAHPEQLEEGVRNPEGYLSYFDHSKVKKGYSGVAVYIKLKVESKKLKVEYGLGVEKLDQEGRFIAVYFDNFVLINCYFPNGGGGPERLKFKMEYYDAFLQYINNLREKGLGVIFCGDVNTAHNEIDLARPKENEKNTGFLPMEREWLDKVVENGYVDVFRNRFPKEIKYTWWDMKTFARDRNVGWRIDYFFVNKELLPKVKDVKILDNVLGSDHCPISLEVKD